MSISEAAAAALTAVKGKLADVRAQIEEAIEAADVTKVQNLRDQRIILEEQEYSALIAAKEEEIANDQERMNQAVSLRTAAQEAAGVAERAFFAARKAHEEARNETARIHESYTSANSQFNRHTAELDQMKAERTARMRRIAEQVEHPSICARNARL